MDPNHKARHERQTAPTADPNDDTSKMRDQPGDASLPWLSSVLVALSSIPFATIVSITAIAIAMMYSLPPAQISQAGQVGQWMERLTSSPISFLLLIVPGQMTFLVLALAGGFFSRDPLLNRLAIRRGHLSPWYWIVLACATPSIGYATGKLIEFFEWVPSDHLMQLQEMIGTLRDDHLLVVTLIVAFLPGTIEELLFRGYVQSRLLRVWPAAAGIAFSSIVFAIAHLDPMHVAAVFPIGVWLSVIAWRCGSVWPAIVGHIANNSASVLLAPSPNHPQGLGAKDYLIWGSTICLVLSLVIILMSRRKNPRRQVV